MFLGYLGYCKFLIPSRQYPQCYRRCNEPAIAKVWWEEGAKDPLFVCKKHLEVIKKREKEIED